MKTLTYTLDGVSCTVRLKTADIEWLCQKLKELYPNIILEVRDL